MNENNYSSYAASIGAVKEGLTYKEELELLAKRFEMTEMQTTEFITHIAYITGVMNQPRYRDVLEREFANYVDECDCDYNCDGSPIEDEYDEDEEEPPF